MTNKKINIPLSESDLRDLQANNSFDWTFDGIDVHLFKAQGLCDHCSEEIEQSEGLCNDCIPIN